MFKKSQVLFLFSETPVHAGTGTSLGTVDLPIQRERHTDYPIIQASGLKGAFRSWYEQLGDDQRRKAQPIFGPEKIEADDGAYAGAVSFTDARCVLFAVRSLRGVYAFITSELALHRLYLDLCRAGIKPDWSIESIKLGSSGTRALVCKNTQLKDGNSIVLEEFAFEASENEALGKVGKWLSDNALLKDDSYKYWREKLQRDLVVLPENAFRDFVRMSTDVQAHICIDDETRTVREGALFYEECLPCDCLLSASVMAYDPYEKAGLEKAEQILNEMRTADGKRIQMGGKATTGKGIMAVRFAEGKA